MVSHRRLLRGAIRTATLFVALHIGLATDAAAQAVVGGLFQPVAFAQHPGDPAVWFVAQQDGVIWLLRNRVRQPAPFLDLRGAIGYGGENGLLGLAFPENYSATGRFYVNFTDPGGHTVVARFLRSTINGDVADASTRKDMVWSTGLPRIVRTQANHKGGCLAFGPDGYLYVASGDSGSGGDFTNAAQDANELRGKILRIDVSSVALNHPNGFVVPADNPFVDGVPISARPEIWAFGLRNPWKISFDNWRLGGTGALLIGDVGQNAFEEIDYEPVGNGGRNYGWSFREGANPFNDPTPPPGPAFLPFVDPIYNYGRSLGASVSGGYVYRGSRRLSMRGRYYFADFISGRVWSFLISGDTAQNLIEHTAELGGAAMLGNISGFGEDVNGELYVLNYTAGTIVEIHPLTSPANIRVIR
jgi:glucose/arabinose dehydrogenase